MRAALDDYLRQGQAEGWSPKTLRTYRERLELLGRALGWPRPAEVRPSALDRFLDGLRRTGWKHESRRGVASSVRRFFAWLAGQGKVLADPSRGLELGRREEQELPPPPLSTEETAAFLDGLPRRNPADLRNKALLEVLYGCGLRLGEALALDLRDVNFENRTVHVRDGNRRMRKVVSNSGALNGTTDFYYDNNGGLLKEWDAGGAPATYYEYGPQQLVTKVTPASGNAWNFYYDGRLNRYLIDQGGTPAYYNWDGLNLLEERTASGSLKARYAHGYTRLYGIGSVAEVERTAYFQYPLMDHRGTAYAVTDVNQAVQLSYVQDAFGRQLTAVGGANPNVPNDLIYQTNWLTVTIGGRRYGLSRYRIYDFETGTFLSRDFLPYLNKYRAWSNNPLDQVDRDGLASASSFPPPGWQGMSMGDEPNAPVMWIGPHGEHIPGTNTQIGYHLTVSLVQAPIPGNCGAYRDYKTRFDLNTPSLKGGYVIQHVLEVITIYDCDGNDITDAKSPYGRFFEYWEAFRIGPGRKTTSRENFKGIMGDSRSTNATDDGYDDVWSSFSEYPCTRGNARTGGEATFHEGLTANDLRKLGFRRGNPKTGAGDAWSTLRNPNLRGSSNTVYRILRTSWDCCEPADTGISTSGGIAGALKRLLTRIDERNP